MRGSVQRAKQGLSTRGAGRSLWRKQQHVDGAQCCAVRPRCNNLATYLNDGHSAGLQLGERQVAVDVNLECARGTQVLADASHDHDHETRRQLVVLHPLLPAGRLHAQQVVEDLTAWLDDSRAMTT